MPLIVPAGTLSDRSVRGSGPRQSGVVPQQAAQHRAEQNHAAMAFHGQIHPTRPQKRVDAPYRSERTEAWWKVKTVQRDKFPVVGFTKDPTGVAALWASRTGKICCTWGRLGQEPNQICKDP
ncbi:putative ATP dependent DNA ligase [Bradyrhizobium japonicum SEMIA 5079]|nr:putative ATP dependent DNA ligase [Bradyrhizobium japonicum SEMIA 5079]